MNETATKTVATQAERQRVSVVGLRADVSGHELAVERVGQLARLGEGSYVCCSTVHMVMESFDDPEFGAKVNGADLIVTDGMPLVWMQKLQGVSNAERVRGNDLMLQICEYAGKNDLKVGFYGGSEEVIETILKKAEEDFPKLQIPFAFSPPFRPLTAEEDARITEQIRDAGVQILFVGLGCPKQENWMHAHRDKLDAVMIGVGAAFDFYVGNVREAPGWLGNLGLEWLYRLFQEPRRLWKRYLLLNPRFVFLATLQLLGLKKFER